MFDLKPMVILYLNLELNQLNGRPSVKKEIYLKMGSMQYVNKWMTIYPFSHREGATSKYNAYNNIL